MRQKILKQVGVLLTVSILLTFLVVSLTMYSKFNGYMHDSVREEAEYIRVAIEETEGDYLNEKISSLKSDNRITLLNTDGTVLYDSLEDASAMGNHGNRPEVKEAEKKGSGEMLRYSEITGQTDFLLRYPAGGRKNSPCIKKHRFCSWVSAVRDYTGGCFGVGNHRNSVFCDSEPDKKTGGTNQYDGSGTPAATCGI